MRDWITADEVADLFGVHRNTVREWAIAGLIPSRVLPSGRRRYVRSDIEAIVASEDWRNVAPVDGEVSA